ncbi:MAG: peptidoglycan-binding protein [Clostridia bacterium]|nr:peptidoglycan-binding protein [Clostridia bacterium]
MRKKSSVWLRILAGVLLVALLLTATAGLAATRYPYQSVTTDKVNLRKGASSGSDLVRRLEPGTEVTVIGKNGKFYHVQVDGDKGYIHEDYLAAYGSETQKALNAVGGYPYETTAHTRTTLYAKNDRTSKVLGTIRAGDTVTVLGETNSYAKVTWNGTTGYTKKANLRMKTVTKAAATPTPEPTLAPGADSTNYQSLTLDSQGEAVTALQQALTELGYFSGTADGIFGENTAAAVRAFQERNEYPVTGAADANLQAFLYSGKPKNSTGTATKVKTLAPIEGAAITSGSTGMLVGTLQIRLRELGYYNGAITMTYDTATQRALKSFQKANGLTADGVAGDTTQDLLFSAQAIAANSAPAVTEVPTPTPEPTYERPKTTVQRHSTGADAKLVQRRLKQLGYYRGAVDGNFGSGSVTALKNFQRNNGLVDDGIAGKGTYDILFSNEARAMGVTPTPVILATPEPTPSPTPALTVLTPDSATVIRQGVTGEAVASLQRRLTELGYYQATVDGICKADDVAAIRTFQQRNGLKVDGVAGYETQARLYSQSAVLYSGAVAAGNIGTTQTLRVGMTGTEVSQIQAQLIKLGYLFGEPDGIFGTATANGLISFQRNNGLKQDGIAGSQTQQKLFSTSAVSAKAAATPAPTAKLTVTGSNPTSSGLLKLGDTSTAVKSMQQQLITLGYLKGSADGNFGKQTLSALQAFQRAKGLKADGVAGALTLAALGSSSSSGSTSATEKKSTAAPTATAAPVTANSGSTPKASQVLYDNWYSTIKSVARKYSYITVYDFSSGLSWQMHIFSVGAHADCEPLTTNDTARMERAFGGNTWNPKAVWVVFGDGSVYLGSTHSNPHGVQHITTNGFAGHTCIHFPRTTAQVTAIGPYATSHQASIDAGWRVTQNMR